MAQGEGNESSAAASKRRLSTDVTVASHLYLSRLKAEWGLRSFGAVIDRLLLNVFEGPVEDQEPGVVESMPERLSAPVSEPHPLVRSPATAPTAGSNPLLDRAVPGSSRTIDPEQQAPVEQASDRAMAEGREAADSDFQSENQRSTFTETGALVLVQREGSLEASLEFDDEPMPRRRTPSRREGGIDLPGFVRRKTAQLRRSLNPPSPDQLSHGDVLPSLAQSDLLEALATAADHWLSLYGQPAHEAVLEASMTWLAQDIWTQSDQSEGEAFTWTLAQRMILPCAPSWEEGPPTLERVIVLAGLLEDPFSASTLSLRIPTLIRRFVHRFRRRRKGASFQTLEHTMTLHGALKVLQIPIDSGQRLTLPLIRDAYHEMAMNHHPDAGGSVEMMRRLNEAYQLLKELYRNKDT